MISRRAAASASPSALPTTGCVAAAGPRPSAASPDVRGPLAHRAVAGRIHDANVDAGRSAVERPGAKLGRNIVRAGPLVAKKNFALAINAFARLDRALGARLVILGEGEQRRALEKLVARL